MKKTLICSLALALITQLLNAQITLPRAIKEQIISKVFFTENLGQISDQSGNTRPDILFAGNDGNLCFYIRNNGISYQLRHIDSYKEQFYVKTREKYKIIDKNSVYRVDASWKNCNRSFTTAYDTELPGYSNYYLPVCPNGIHNVRTFNGFTLKNIYNNIDVHYYEKDGILKCDYLVAPNTDHKQIQIEIKGAQISLNKNGTLRLRTALGDIEEGAPLVYQNGKKLSARWIIKNNVLSFGVDNLNPALPILIDPATRVWATYMGGSGTDNARSVCTNTLGDVLMCGETQSTGTLIATAGAHQTILIGGGYNAFLEKYDGNGVRQWGTFYGGGSDRGTCCASDGSGNVYMGGYTQCTTGTFIATVGSHQPNFGAGPGSNPDGFLVKFNSAGVRQWGTYYGGTNGDWVYGCALNQSGTYVWIVGTTTSTNAIYNSGYDNTLNGISDAFIAKFNPAGVRQWGSYYGGIDMEDGYDCAPDISGNIYFSGYTASVNNNTCCVNPIASPGSHQYTKSGNDDGFLARFDNNGFRDWGTYYGGSGNEYATTVTTFSNNVVFLGGYTSTSSGGGIPGGPTAHQPTYGGGSSDGFLAKFDGNGVRSWGSYYGGTGNDYVQKASTDPTGNVYICGITSSTVSTVIATPGSHQFVNGGGTNDAFLAKLSTTGPRQWGTYYGGNAVDNGMDCVATNGALYLAGSSTTSGGTVIATTGSQQDVLSGGQDAFLVRFYTCVNGVTVTPSQSVVCSGTSLTLSATGADNYTWSPGGSTLTSIVVSPTTTINYTVTGGALGCTSSSVTFSYSVNPLPTITVNSGSICLGTSFTINPSGAVTYTYSGGGPIVSPTINSSYSVTGTDGNGCVSNPAAISNVTVVYPTITVNSGSICPGQSFTINPSGGAVSYSYAPAGPIVTPTATSAFTVTGTDNNGCVNSIGAVSNVTVAPSPTITVNSGAICTGQSFTMVPGGAATYTYSSGSAIVSPVTNTSYSVIGTSSVGCVGSSTAVCSVVVNTVPIVTVNSGSICQGQSFTIAPNGASTYTFSSGSPVVSPNTNTSYTVTGTSFQGCNNTVTAISNVTVLPSPTLSTMSSGSICIGESATLTVSGGSTYTWSTGGTNSTEVVSPTISTVYTVSGTGANGCQSSIIAIQNVDPCTGIRKYNSNSSDIKIYPNPNNGEFSVELSSVSESTQIEIYNVTGQLVLKTKPTQLKMNISMAKIANGIYELRIIDTGKIIKQEKIIKE
jgi:hypothetical protein